MKDNKGMGQVLDLVGSISEMLEHIQDYEMTDLILLDENIFNQRLDKLNEWRVKDGGKELSKKEVIDNLIEVLELLEEDTSKVICSLEDINMDDTVAQFVF
jgi:hypothetical protein